VFAFALTRMLLRPLLCLFVMAAVSAKALTKEIFIVRHAESLTNRRQQLLKAILTGKATSALAVGNGQSPSLRRTRREEPPKGAP
jgi:hypothetical protein